MTAVDTIYDQALALPAAERAELAGRLLRSLSGPYAFNATTAILTSLPDPVTGRPSPSLADHPLFDEFVEATKEYRRQREAEEEALERHGN